MSNFDQYRRVIEHEDNLINQRFSWFILAQSFLLVAWFTTNEQKADYQFLIAFAALGSCFFPYISIIAAVEQLNKIMKEYKKLQVELENGNVKKRKNYPPLTSGPVWHRLGLVGAVATPPIFFFIWLDLLALPFRFA